LEALIWEDMVVAQGAEEAGVGQKVAELVQEQSVLLFHLAGVTIEATIMVEYAIIIIRRIRILGQANSELYRN
jgi:hypothetical protein